MKGGVWLENDFQVVTTSEADDGTIVMTGTELSEERYKQALAAYDPANRRYSAYLNETGSAPTLTLSEIDTLGDGAQNDIDKILSINAILRGQINTDDLIGMVVQSIQNNINTKYTLEYDNSDGVSKKKKKTLERAKSIIDDFNKQIDLKCFIRESVLLAYTEGTYMCLLKNNKDNWLINYLPLGVAENSGYTANNNPIILINIQNLRSALQKTYNKKRNGRALIFGDMEEEVKNSFNSDVYTAFKNREKYAKLDTDFTGTVRVNNYGRKYGLSPLFRALKSCVMLSNFEKADEVNARARAKKIIHQILRKEVLGDKGTHKGDGEMTFAHDQFMQAYKNNTVAVTSIPAVEKIVYVEPKVQDTNDEKIASYRNKALASLGVSFLTNDNSQTASTANISLRQLMQCINGITEQVECVLRNFYRTVLRANGIGEEFVPEIHIIDSEMLEADMRLELAKLLYTTFGCSRETTLGIIGVNLNDEKAKREAENAEGLDEVFTPYPLSYTTSGNDPGRPSGSQDPDKQAYDEGYNGDGRASK